MDRQISEKMAQHARECNNKEFTYHREFVSPGIKEYNGVYRCNKCGHIIRVENESKKAA